MALERVRRLGSKSAGQGTGEDIRQRIRRASAVWSRVKVGLRGSKLTRNSKDRIDSGGNRK